MSGAFFESYVFPEIYKSYLNVGKELPIYYVLEPLTREEAFGGLESLKVEIGTGSVVCMANDLLPVDEKLVCAGLVNLVITQNLGEMIEQSWGQRVDRFYNLNGHIIEVGKDVKMR